ncbi:AMP-binding protein [Kiloniella majae]|uniref:AMP-binding protein n=1 Tax=Kiloniella majae TaxID=1938558 RepID=UPI000A2770AE|nr:AMP-binding protein [Kiloniella majae]
MVDNHCSGGQNHHELAQNPANYVPLSPLSFIERAKDIYPERAAVIYGTRKYSWAQTYQRCTQLASALTKQGVKKGDVVSIIAANTPELLEAHFGVPMSGAVLNTINTRLDPDTIAYIFEHAETKVLLADVAFSSVVKKALALANRQDITVVDIVDWQDVSASLQNGSLVNETNSGFSRLGVMDYETFLESGTSDDHWSLPTEEWQSLALNYTSGTSGRPKGVLYHHRGAYLMAMGTVLGWELAGHPVYLYTVPMFHCNGWGHAWTMAALAGTVVCCRTITAEAIFQAISEQGITHFGGAPVVLNMLVNATDRERKLIRHLVDSQKSIKVMTAGAPPPPSILAGIQALGFDVMQVYGLTETYGHVVHCTWKEEWNQLPNAQQAGLKARQGVRFPTTEGLRVVNLETGEEVAKNGKAMGEIQIRGNTIMKGYLKNSEATDEAFEGGWFHSGDIAVVHGDGYIEVKDRLKDIIISGGENISSVEVENVLYKHSDVLVAAVVAQQHDKWGEVPCAFVELKADASCTEEDIIAFCRDHLAGFKTPKTVVFDNLPKTSTGKVKKFLLREQLKY